MTTTIPTDFAELLALQMFSIDQAVQMAERVMQVPPASYLQHAAVTVIADAILSCADADDLYDRIAQVAVDRYEDPTLSALMVEINRAIASVPSVSTADRAAH